MVRVSKRHADSDRLYGCILAVVMVLSCAIGTAHAADGACATIETHDILCQADGSFTWSFTLTNTSGQTATALIFGDPAITPQAVPLGPPLLNGTSATMQFTITGPLPGAHLCFPIILANVQGDVCCHLDYCLDLPDCDCAQFSQVQLTATATPGTYALNFTFTNLAAWNAGHLIFFGPSLTFAPSIVNLPPTPPFGSQPVGPITVTTAAPAGTLICFTIGNHSVNWTNCCFIELCVVVPDDGSHCPPSDLNHDGVVDSQDLAILLGAWGNSGGGFLLGDLNGDAIVDAQDLAILLGDWGLMC